MLKQKAVVVYSIFCNDWAFTSQQRPKFEESSQFENVFRFLWAAMLISYWPSLTVRSIFSVEAENGLQCQLVFSFGKGKYSLIDVWRFLICYIISEAFYDKGVSDSDTKLWSVEKHSVISFFIQHSQNWIFSTVLQFCHKLKILSQMCTEVIDSVHWCLISAR